MNDLSGTVTTTAAPGTTRDRAGLHALAGVGLLLIVLTACGPFLHFKLGGLAHWAVLVATAGGAFWAAVCCDRIDRRQALWIIGIVAIAMRLSMLPVVPYLSDDIYRYIWDGRVQAAGINPYRYIPAAPELAHLRDAAIYPLINRADYAPTIYPPGAQMFYLLVTRFSESVLAMRFALMAMEALAIAATLMLLKRLNLPPTRIAAFAWHPLAVWEIAGNGHVDAAMLGLLMLALSLFVSRRTLIAGAVVTAAALVKPVALVVLPVFWRPWNLRLPAVVLATAAAMYAPYLGAGWKVLGFLPGYLKEEELSHGTGFRFLMIAERLFGPLPGAAPVYVAICGLALLALALAVGFRRDRSDEAGLRGAALMLTAFLVVLTPHYPWYYLALVPFLAIFPTSATLWLLTVGGLQTYQAVAGEFLPDYVDRQVVFHSLVVVAIVRDLWFAKLTGATAPSKTAEGSTS